MRNNDPTYMELVALRDSLDARQTELQSELEDVTRKLESVGTTLALLDGEEMPLAHRIGLTRTPTRQPASAIDVASLRGLRQLEALTKIAEHYGGQFQNAVAKKLLIQAGLISNPKNAGNILYAVIQRSGKFERVEPGVYRLVGHKPEKPEKLALPLESE